IATLVVGNATSTYTERTWTMDISSWTFVDLSTNTQYSFRVFWREPPSLDTTLLIAGATRTLAAVTPAPSVAVSGFDSAELRISSGTNPTTAPNNTEFAILIQIAAPANSPHNGKYVPAPAGGYSDLDNVSDTPVWRTLSQWGGNNTLALKSLIGSTEYGFRVKARNGNRIETSSSPAASLIFFPRAPRNIWMRNQPPFRPTSALSQGTWVNVLITSFTSINSSHYHYRFNQDGNDSENVDSADTSYGSNEVITVTATASGPWYFHAMGDTYGFSGSINHTIIGSSRFEVKVDTTSPSISNLRAQFSPDDTTPIRDGVTTPRRQPNFVWSSPLTDTISESPITGYSTVFSTTTDPGNAAVPEVVRTTQTFAHFPVGSTSDRTSGTYYFRVKAKDSAGNWGNSSLFVYKFQEDLAKPIPSVQQVSGAQGVDGRYLSVGSSPTIKFTFGEDMKENTVVSTRNILMTGIRDNNGIARVLPTTCTLTYDSANRVVEITPVNQLNRGWLYEVTVTTRVLDLGENPIEVEKKIKFEVLMDRSRTNQFVAADGKTKVVIPPGAMPEDITINISVVSGGVDAAPNNGQFAIGPEGSPFRGFHALQYASANSLNAANDKIKTIVGSFAQPVTIREFAAINGSGQQVTSNFNSAVTVNLPYLDADNDGYVDGTSPKVKASKLTAYVLDETSQIWHKVPNTTVDSGGKSVSLPVSHFSVYALMGAPDNDVSQSYAYPVPYRPSQGHSKVTFANLPSEGNIRVYTVAGDLVKKIDFLASSGESKYEWDVKNSGGEDVASDVYLYVIESGGNKKKGELVIVR
ncbi:MAG: Ig-like domain-containing protein, partial [Elusimicrobia bacterium]|nr:Ig-like domain-containing protein [Elusimicrobiota bacterium]